MERLCLDCGKAVKGRTDKKFCDDNCRNSYNNHLKNENGLVFKRINLALKKNRTLLAKFNPDGKVKVSKKKCSLPGLISITIHILITLKTAKNIFSVMNLAI
jgi:predicted nucleic acid-binding Zn ribbon protein